MEAVLVFLDSRPEITFAYIHGSFADSGPFGDLDIAVFLRPNAVPSSPFHYEDRLAQEISAELNLSVPVDIRLLNRAPIAFQYRVFQGRLLVDRDPEIRAEQSAYVPAKQLQRIPEEYVHCFLLLGENKLIPGDLAERLAAMAPFRNRLVHMYWDIDYRQIYDIIAHDVGDLGSFVHEVASWF